MWHVWGTEEMHTGFWWRPVEKRLLGRPKHRWEDNIMVDLHVVGWGSMDLIALAQNRDRQLTPVSVVMNLQVS